MEILIPKKCVGLASFSCSSFLIQEYRNYPYKNTTVSVVTKLASQTSVYPKEAPPLYALATRTSNCTHFLELTKKYTLCNVTTKILPLLLVYLTRLFVWRNFRNYRETAISASQNNLYETSCSIRGLSRSRLRHLMNWIHK